MRMGGPDDQTSKPPFYRTRERRHELLVMACGLVWLSSHW